MRVAGSLKRAASSLSSSSAIGVEETNKRGRAAGRVLVEDCKKRGNALLNRGAGVMPVGANAPHGGERYTLLVDPPGSKVLASVPPHTGLRDPDGSLVEFAAVPSDANTTLFKPRLSPAECIRSGIFGGCYFNPRGGKAGIFGRDVSIAANEFPAEWFEGVDPGMYSSRRYNAKAINKFKVKAGQDQAFWEGKGWIHQQDPRGWFQWYCRFYMGRRTQDDLRQIKRWAACAGVTGRWRNQLCGKVSTGRAAFDDPSVSPVIRQTLLHWAYELSECDYELWKQRH